MVKITNSDVKNPVFINPETVTLIESTGKDSVAIRLGIGLSVNMSSPGLTTERVFDLIFHGVKVNDSGSTV